MASISYSSRGSSPSSPAPRERQDQPDLRSRRHDRTRQRFSVVEDKTSQARTRSPIRLQARKGRLHLPVVPPHARAQCRGKTSAFRSVRRLHKARQRALAALDMVGLAAKAHLRPDQMSHGEKQRVAVARPSPMAPVWCSPTSLPASLDAANGAQVTQLLADIARDNERIVAVVTHDPRMLPVAQRIVRLEDGRIAGDQLCHA